LKNKLSLILNFTKREFKERYVGTSFGHLWHFISPLITILIYTIIFSDFMKMKLKIVDNSYSYSIYLISGLLAWTAFSTTVLRLNNSFFDKASIIKKINIPMYIFQASIALSEFITFVISMTLAIIFLILVNQPVTVNFLWLIPIMLIQTLFAFSLGVIFSLFAVFFKDLREIVPIVFQLWFWMTPIVYVKDVLEQKYPFLLTINPFFYFADTYQNLFLYSKAPSLHNLAIIAIETGISFLLAVYLYKKMISAIKDII